MGILLIIVVALGVTLDTKVVRGGNDVAVSAGVGVRVAEGSGAVGRNVAVRVAAGVAVD